MPGKSANHNHSHHHFTLPILILIVIVGFLGYKYIVTKQAWKNHAVELQQGIQKEQTSSSVQDADIIATTITTVPQGSPLFTNQPALQSYISNLSSKTDRYIVVLDKNQKILASKASDNVGLTYNLDGNGEIEKTLFDGNPRSFIEKSTVYPNGINLEVVQVKNAAGTIVGTILISPANTTTN